jgi:hypothetical protein
LAVSGAVSVLATPSVSFSKILAKISQRRQHPCGFPHPSLTVLSHLEPKGPLTMPRPKQLLPVFAATLFSAAALTGCSNMVSTAGANATTQAGALSGSVHGGQQPVVGATVTLWAAGNAGYGSAATMLAQTISGSGGTFSFGPGSGNTYTCPSTSSTTASQQVYITASGGDPTPGVANASAAFMTAIGDCLTTQAQNPTIVINEVTTAASVFALQQFFTPSSSGLGSIGTSSTNITGLRNAFATVANLVNVATGSAVSSLTASGAVTGYSTAPSVTITPEQSKINTIADILAACINNTTTGTCSTLFSSVNSTAAKDTLQAAYYMASNPTDTVSGTSNLSTVFGLATPQSPFGPSLTTAPTDWTIGVTYGSNSTQTVSATPVYFLTDPEYIAIDSVGDIWAVNYSSSTAGVAGNSVSEISATGTPLAQVLTAPGNLVGPRDIVVDPSNNIFVASYGASGAGQQVTEYSNLGVTNTFPLLKTGPEAMASDGAGNIYVATYGGADGSGDLEAIPANATSGTTAALQASSVSVGGYSQMAIDPNFNIWLPNNKSTATTQFLCAANPCTATSTTLAPAPQSAAIDHAGDVWLGNYASAGSGKVTELAATNNSTITQASGSPFNGGGLASAISGMIDGNGNVWESNYASGAGSVTELTSAGAAVSPSSGFSHTYAGAYYMAIDNSGNVWIGNRSATASGTAQGFITEIVGAAGPVVTPLAAGLPTAAGGANSLGKRP